MKKTLRSLFAVGILLLSCQNTHAAPAAKTAAPAAAPTSTVSSSSASSGSSINLTETAFGFSDTSYITNGQTLSAMLGVGASDWIHPFFGVNQTEGALSFSIGGAYLITVHGDRRAGFHVGPGLSLGTVAVGDESKFGFSLFGLAGAHYTFFDRLIVSVDGGPILTDVDSKTNFRIRPAGDLLGLSVHYVF